MDDMAGIGGGAGAGAGAGAGPASDGSGPGIDGFPNYAKEKERCKQFLVEFRTPSFGKEVGGDAQYLNLIQSVADGTEARFCIDLKDVQMHEPALALAIVQNTRRYADLFASAIDELMPAASRALEDNSSLQDILRVARLERVEANPDAAGGDPRRFFPPRLLRTYEVRFSPLADAASKPLRLRDIGAVNVGKLVTAECMVVRASDVKPQIDVAAYTCDVCGHEVYQEVAGKTFTPLSECVSDVCKANKVRGAVRLATRTSKFVRYQELRVQELPDQVPVGHIPRSLTVICRADTTRSANPGDIIALTGIFLPSPFTGYQAMRAGLTADTYVEAHEIRRVKRVDVDRLEEGADERIDELAENGAYERLAKAIAPEIFGLTDVKKALLLQLVGGVTQHQRDGMKTRGDINVCLMGDPGVAKSQLLKHIAKLAPRAVYTTGRGSSGVGLTAAVVRDPLSNELTLEGGALVLADMGICCIDEFDKMDESDRTAIHEVMEQQTVSIAKAGITTTLNARTAILAAANPRYGRYNRRADRDAHVALQKNINLPAALLSRFDLLFLLLDEVDGDNDRALASHVTYVHQNGAHPTAAEMGFAGAGAGPEDSFSLSFIRQYLVVAKHVCPTIPRHLMDYVVRAYVDMRAKDKARATAAGGRSTLTARQLLSILRLAQAHARLEMRMDILQKDIDEAIRLVNVSKSSVLEADAGDKPIDGDFKSRLWALLRDRAFADGTNHVSMEDLMTGAAAAGYSSRQVEEFLAEYGALGLVEVNPSRTRVDLVTLDG